MDKADKPTHITTEIIGNLVHYDLVVADLSDLNANVFYELGIRHAFQKPCILISDWKIRPPFDVSGVNVIRYTYDDVASHRDCRDRIKAQVEALRDSDTVSNPVTVALGFEKLSEKGDDISKLVVSLAEQVQGMRAELGELRTTAIRERIARELFSRNAHSSIHYSRNALGAIPDSADGAGLLGLISTEDPDGEN